MNNNKVVSYWRNQRNHKQMALLTVYEIKEIVSQGIELSEDFYTRFYQFCDQACTEVCQTSELEKMIELCEALPTPLLMYFMQMVNKKNSRRFADIYKIMNQNRRFDQLMLRCKTYEKNLILMRILDKRRLKSVQQALMEEMG